MDKYEYKIRAEEINTLIAEGKFPEAVKIADTIDWRRVKSVMMLCKISDLYKINRRYQESRDILLLAYEKHPTGRLIVYSLCELSIKMEEYVQAIEYYKEFVQIAPKDTGRYILQYRLYEAQDVSLEERIAVLEEFKKRDYREKWAYELAYLYHRIGLSTKCVEECDEMFLWFGEGKYVVKALELKKLHEPLNEDQQDKYELWMQAREAEGEPYEEEPEDTGRAGAGSANDFTTDEIRYTEPEEVLDTDGLEPGELPTTELPEVKTVDVGQYNTINLQMELAESMREILEEEARQETPAADVPAEIYEPAYEEEAGYEPAYAEEAGYGPEDTAGEETESVGPDLAETGTAQPEPMLTENERPAEETVEEAMEAAEAETFVETEAEETGISQEPAEEEPVDPMLKETIRLPDSREVERRLQETSVRQFPKRAEMAKAPERRRPAENIEAPKSRKPAEGIGTSESRKPAGSAEAPKGRKPVMDTDNLQEISAQIVREDTAAFDAQHILEQMKQEAQRQAELSGVLTPLNTKPSKYDRFLSQEYDGQISLVMPEQERVEKQITGQLSIGDIMAEWEEMKKTNEQKRMEDVRKRILEHTGDLFANFDEATKNGLLEELERAFVAALMKETDKKTPVRKTITADAAEKKQAAAKHIRPEPAPETDITGADIAGEAAADAAGPAQEAPGTEAPVTEETQDSAAFVTENAAAQETEEHRDRDAARERELTEEERELFGEFIHHRRSERQLVHTLDNMSLAPYTGNVLITGEEEETTLMLAKTLIREMQLGDSNFSGKVAKISAAVLNKKNVQDTFGKLNNGALIIENASRLRTATVGKMVRVLDKDNMGLLVLMIDKKQDMNDLIAGNEALKEHFNLRVDIEALDDEALVAYAKQYAEDLEYSIDEFGILALHTRIADMQTSDHEVNTAEVRELVDEAIYYANKKTPGHFMDILLAKRYDEEDMIVLREKDFMHY